MATKAAAKTTKARTKGKRELIDTGRDKRYVRRDESGRFEEVVDVGRSLSQDRRRTAKKQAKSGYGDQGDRQVTRTRATKTSRKGKK